MIDGRRITEIIRKKVTKAQQHFHHSIHYQSFLPIFPDWRSNVLDNGENGASHFKPRSKETPSPSPFPPKIYNAILDISTIRITAKNPLKNLIRVFAFGFLTDYHRFPYYGIQQRFQKLRSIARGYSRHGGRESVSKLACVTGRPTRDIGNPRWGFPVHRGKRGEQHCSPPLSGARFVHGGKGNMYPVCHVALVSKSWWWTRRVTLSLLSFPPEGKRASWYSLYEIFEEVQYMDGSLVEKKKIKCGIMVCTLRIFLHICIYLLEFW